MGDKQKAFEKWVINQACASLEKADATGTFYRSNKTRMLWRAWCGCTAELEAENARLRQQRDAANAQLDFILENLNNESK